MMKKLLLLCFISVITSTFAQKNETYIKANALFLPIGMLNVGVEHGFTEHITGQADIFFSPWKSFAGHQAQFGIATVEGRYYFDQAFKHWYLGASLGFGVFNIQKWNYWGGEISTTKEGDLTPYKKNELYQKGFSYMFGLTTGYQFQIGNRWNMDIFLGIGSQQGFYKGYVEYLPETQENRYDRVENWDKSGEIIPFKGGVMISYKL